MLLIEKRQPPKSLVEDVMRLRAGEAQNPGSHQVRYGNLDPKTKDDVEESLLEEQGWLCAYCMRRIDVKSMHIEHYHAQHAGTDEDDELSVRYDNMLAVCDGGRGMPRALQTCDTHRRNANLTVNPWDAGHIRSITYGSDGTIGSRDPDIDGDLRETLNLNVTMLRRNRATALDALKRHLIAKARGGKSFDTLCRRYLAMYRNQDKRTEYAGILLDYLQRKSKG